eukprot:NODE_458_length_7216_cov_0.728537.p7 type:complete len:123 gc:universal NODE_458_length_7216_cov_0.728537:4426-4794(+)
MVLYSAHWISNCLSSVRELYIQNLLRDPSNIDLDVKTINIRTANIKQALESHNLKRVIDDKKNYKSKDDFLFDESYNHSEHLSIIKYCWNHFKYPSVGLNILLIIYLPMLVYIVGMKEGNSN